MHQWFLAILPNEKVSKEIIAFQQELATNYGFQHALKTPPHITIIPPFSCNYDRVQLFTDQIPLLNTLEQVRSFEIRLNGFQAFHPRVIFVDIERNDALLNIAKQVKLLFYQSRIKANRGEKHFFTPHITIANRDLNNKTFKSIYKDFQLRTYQATFQVKSIFLLRKESKTWQVAEEILL